MHQSIKVGGTRALLNFLRELVAYAYLTYLVCTGSLSVSDFIFYFGIITGFSNWIMSFVYLYSNMERCCNDCQAFRDFVESDEEKQCKPNVDFKDVESIEFKNVSFTYPSAENSTINNMSFKVKKGENIAVVGENGAGKTTLIRCLTLLYKEGNSAIFMDGRPVTEDKNYLNKIGYLPQEFGMFKELSVFEAMKLLANFKGVEKQKSTEMIEQCIDFANLTEQKDKKVGALSGGMLRRLGIAQALLNNPKLLIFDEPTAGLDPMERLRFKSIVSEIEKDKITIISTHIVEDIEALCEKVIVMDSGKIIACMTCEELRKYAQGKVYETDEKAVELLQDNCFVEKVFERDGRNYARVLSAQKIDATECVPSVEDGYLCLVNKV